MAIRIRRVGKGNYVVAICAAHSKAKPGDIYIDDAEHHALSAKFSIDNETMGFLERAHVTIAERRRIKWEETERCCEKGCSECPPTRSLEDKESFRDQYLCNHPAMEGAHP